MRRPCGPCDRNALHLQRSVESTNAIVRLGMVDHDKRRQRDVQRQATGHSGLDLPFPLGHSGANRLPRDGDVLNLETNAGERRFHRVRSQDLSSHLGACRPKAGLQARDRELHGQLQVDDSGGPNAEFRWCRESDVRGLKLTIEGLGNLVDLLLG